VLDDKGEAASFDVLVRFAQHHRIAMVSIDQIVEHRKSIGGRARRPALLL
jgi:3,4-dihydroxy-2-butanone 4-phosphate synthase